MNDQEIQQVRWNLLVTLEEELETLHGQNPSNPLDSSGSFYSGRENGLRTALELVRSKIRSIEARRQRAEQGDPLAAIETGLADQGFDVTGSYLVGPERGRTWTIRHEHR